MPTLINAKSVTRNVGWSVLSKTSTFGLKFVTVPILARILTPEEFTKGLEIMSATLQSVTGVTEEMVDRLAALGMISVFDIEEVGPEVLQNELSVDEAVAKAMVEAAATRAREVAEQQAREKEEAERKRREDEEAARRLLAGEAVPAEAEARAAAILGGGPIGDGAAPGPSVTESDEARAADILGTPLDGKSGA